MTTARTLYRSTLVAAALAAGSLAVLPVAQAHDHGWRGRDDQRGWYSRHGDRGWRASHGWRRGWAGRWSSDPPGWDRGRDRDGPWYAPVDDRPPPRAGRDWGGDVAVVVRVPF
jgi:hypothetical protein